MLKPSTFILLSTLALCSCQKTYNSQKLAENPYLKNAAISFTEENLKVSGELLEKAIERVTSSAKTPLHGQVGAFIKEYSKDAEDNVLAYLAYQLYENPSELPVLPNSTYKLISNSQYDKIPLQITLKTPHTPDQNSPLVIFLGSESDYIKDELPSSAWCVFIPSRDIFNYQFLAEGDFLNCVKELTELYPSLEKADKILVGNAKSSRAALYFADAYPYLFNKVAWTGHEDGFEFQNLDQVPLSYYTSLHGASYPYTPEMLISRFQDRGNGYAFAANNLNDSLKFLMEAKVPSQKTYHFNDYQYAKVSKWLEVLRKNSEHDEALIEYALEGNTLNLSGSNLSHIAILPKNFPSEWNVSKITFNDRAWPLKNDNEKMVLSEVEVLEQKALSKAELPSSFMSYWMNEPLHIVYQDRNAPADILELVKKNAEAMASLHFKGFPKHPYTLKATPLSEYDANKLPKHRLIYWGMEASLAQALGKEEGFSPVQFIDNDLYVSSSRIYENFDLDKDLAYMLSTPLEEKQAQMACLFVADTYEGFETLGKELLSSTSLYLPSDFISWQKQGSKYYPLASYTFGGFFDTTQSKRFLFHNPFGDKQTWAQIFSEYLLSRSGSHEVLSKEVLTPIYEAPETFYSDTLDLLLENRTYSKFHLKGWQRDSLVAEIKKLEPTLYQYSRSISQNSLPSDLEITILVDSALVSLLPSAWLNTLEYEPYPYSVKEIVRSGFENELNFFQYEIERIAQEHHLEDPHG